MNEDDEKIVNEVKLKKGSKYLNCPGQRKKGERDFMMGTGERDRDKENKIKSHACQQKNGTFEGKAV